jgi:dihydrofolate synthase/folylpolyglutamate synthase
LERIEERFVIDGIPCPPDEFADLVRSVQPVVDELDAEPTDSNLRNPTFFEITTAMAFLHFARGPVDAAVLEVGLGGRLDSTNVCQPAVCVITSISFDHTKQLGNTLTAIAGEKAGIIKPGVPVISGVMDPEPHDVIAKVAEQVGAPLILRGREFEAGMMSGQDAVNNLYGSTVHYCDSLSGTAYFLGPLMVNLPGEHQANNAGTAIAAIRTLVRAGWKISDDSIRQGLAAVRCPARVEVVRQNPLVIVDAAHNVASIAALCQTLRGVGTGRRILIFASSRDKDAAGMLRLLLPEFDEILLTRYIHNPRARDPEELLALAEQELAQIRVSTPPHCQATTSPTAAWQEAQTLAGDNALVCITGSFFLAAELRPLVTV